MATIEAELFARLSGHAGLLALVGSRIFNGLAPQGVDPPFVTFHRIDTTRPGRAMGSDGNLRQALFQFSVYAASPDGVSTVRRQIAAALDRWVPPSADAGDQALIEDDGRDHAFDDTADLHGGSVDAMITFRE